MEFERLNEFILLAQTGSFKETAQQLNISPATLSARIATLEKSVQKNLLNHKSRSFELTEHGQLFLVDAKDIFKNYQQSVVRISEIQDNVLRSLSIAATGKGMPPRLEPYLSNLCSQHPNIHLELLDDTMYNIQNGLYSGAVDVYFAYSKADFTDATIQHQFLFSTRLCVLVSKKHPLAQKSSVNLKELDGELFYLYPKTLELSLHNLEHEILRQSGIRYTISFDNMSKTFYQHSVAVGKGVAFCPWVLRDHIPKDTIEIPLENPECSVNMYMHYLKSNPNPTAVQFVHDVKKMRF